MNWQWIESAPKDNTIVLICVPGEPLPKFAYWRQDKRYAAGGTWQDADRIDYVYPNATHWMPMPPKLTESHSPATGGAPQKDDVAELVAALREMTEDLEARWDMSHPSTNPGIVVNVERANKVLAKFSSSASR